MRCLISSTIAPCDNSQKATDMTRIHRHPMRDINNALTARNRVSDKIRQLEGELRDEYQSLIHHEKACFDALPEDYFIVLDAHWSIIRKDIQW